MPENTQSGLKLLAVAEYAKHSGITLSVIYREIKQGIIPTHQFGRKKLIDPIEADEARRTKLDHSLNAWGRREVEQRKVDRIEKISLLDVTWHG